MTIFNVGELYTRDQVRAAVGLPPMSGGDWATGYARFGDEIFVFANIGVAGRTGHDYPNHWIDDALDWFGKTGSTLSQPMIDMMIKGTATTHIFWRGRDRAPFTYAGIGIAEGVWGKKPVEVLWRFAEPDQRKSARPEAVFAKVQLAATFRHGPPPSFGFRQFLAEDAECHLYLMVLEGAVDALFPSLMPRATTRSIVKVGISVDPQRRERELNAGFPRGSAARWVIRRTRIFATAAQAYNAEGDRLQRLADSNCWLGGEFAIIADNEVDGLLE